MIKTLQLPRHKTIALALASVLANWVPVAGHAQTLVISTSTPTIIWNTGDVTVTNTGVVSGSTTGVVASGTVGTLTNSGTISGSSTGIRNNSGTIGTLTNSGTITGGSGIYNGGTITSLTNSGTISGGGSGIYNGGTITSLTNSGTISGGSTAIRNSGTIGTLTNSGTITGGSSGGIYNGGTIGTLTNSGTITGGSGIYNDGTIGALTNSGTISGSWYAINNSGSGMLGPITNAGVIAGNISNASSNDLTISGGTGTVVGTLTGFGGAGTIGTITNTASNVVFGSGNLLLNDHINAGSHTVNNSGATLQVNTPLNITGNYSQGAGAALLIGVQGGAVANGTASDSGYGRLVVSGSATIDPGSSVGLKSQGYAFASGQRFVVVNASSTGTNYNESSLHYSASGFGGTITGVNVTAGNRSDLLLTLSPASTPTPATAPNAVSALTGLSSYTGISDPALLNLYNAAQALNQHGTPSQANKAGAQLAPTQSAARAGAAAASTRDVLMQVAGRADNVRLAQAYGSGVATGERLLDRNAWGQLFGGHANQGMADQVDGYKADYSGLVLGTDKAVGDNWRAGGAFSYSHTSIDNQDNTAGDTTRINGYGLIGYASYTGAAWYLNLSGGALRQQFDTTRVIDFTGFSGTAKGSFKGWQHVVSAEAGQPIAAGAYTLTPMAGLTYLRQSQDAYTESGGNGAALSVGSSHATSLRSSLGMKLERSFDSAYGMVVPSVQLKWLHEHKDSAAATSARYAGDPAGETAFTTVGATPLRNLAALSLGVTLLRANNMSLAARYEVQSGSQFVSQTGSLRLRMAF